MNTQTVTLDVTKRTVATQVVKIRQGDIDGTTIVANIYDNGIPATLTSITDAYLVMRLPDGKHYYRKSGTISGNSVTVVIDETEAASVTGRINNAYITLCSSTNEYSTGSFVIVVLDDALINAIPPDSIDDAVREFVDEWLDAHPEATTTVQDGSITNVKIHDDTISNTKLVQTGGVLSDVDYLENYLFNKGTATLPAEIHSRADITLATGSKVITGTHNVAELLDIEQGTFTFGDLTITVSGNTLTLSGSPTSTIYFDVNTGTAMSTAELMAATLPIPDGQYSLSQKLTSGTVFPAGYVRSKSSGNVISIQNSVSQFTKSDATCGAFYLYIESSKTYNCEFVIALFPYATDNNNPYREETSNITVITDEGLNTLNGYTWAIGTVDIALLYPKKPLCLYSTRSLAYSYMVECVDVFIPSKSGYVDYIFGKTDNGTPVSQGGGIVWRLVQIDAVNEDLSLNYHITRFGETEMAIKIDGRDDFIGGTTHGDEEMIDSSLRFVLDGEMVDITEITTITEFETLRCFLVSNMYDPADHTTLVGEHGREWVFNSDGLYIGQTVEFLEDLTLGASFMPMICAIRGNDTVTADQITDTYIDDGNYTPYDISTGGFTTYPNQLKTDAREIHLLGEDSKLDITLKLLEQPSGLNAQGSYVYNKVNTYNKIYCCICANGGGVHLQDVSAGDKWHVKSQITVNVG